MDQKTVISNETLKMYPLSPSLFFSSANSRRSLLETCEVVISWFCHKSFTAWCTSSGPGHNTPPPGNMPVLAIISWGNFFFFYLGMCGFSAWAATQSPMLFRYWRVNGDEFLADCVLCAKLDDGKERDITFEHRIKRTFRCIIIHSFLLRALCNRRRRPTSEGIYIKNWNYGGSSEVFSECQMHKKRKDTAEVFSSSLTLASTGRWMNMINRAIYSGSLNNYQLWYSAFITFLMVWKDFFYPVHN